MSTSRFHSQAFKPGLLFACALTLTGCQSTPDLPTALDDTSFAPRLTGTSSLIANTALDELRQLQLISTNLVSALVQLPGRNPAGTTVQVSPPSTVFGHTVTRALEDAGYGLQLVSADQGRHYVSYSERYSETESGPVNDYSIAVGKIRLTRAYNLDANRVFPTSLLQVNGGMDAGSVVLDDSIFEEQGGNELAFVSGVLDESSDATQTTAREVVVSDYEEKPLEQRTTQQMVLDNARQQATLNRSMRESPDLDTYQRLRRTVLIFDDTRTRNLGQANKQAVRLLVRDIEPQDLFVITGCTDVDGINDMASNRAMRVEEEFITHSVESSSLWIAPCRRASYRHASDDSPVPVEVVQYRRP